jgi:putative transposase
MLNAVRLFARVILFLFRTRRELLLENMVLRQQLMVLKRRRPRPALNLFDKLFWLAISRLWLRWKQAVIIVTPETVVRWHRAGFRMYWRLISRVRGPVGRKPTVPPENLEISESMRVIRPS